jgi:hypothetical protein
MKALAEVEIRCEKHEDFQNDCAICCFLKKTENDLQALRVRRAALLSQIRQRLSSRDLVITDLR